MIVPECRPPAKPKSPESTVPQTPKPDLANLRALDTLALGVLTECVLYVTAAQGLPST
jgi:hypothetical protein